MVISLPFDAAKQSFGVLKSISQLAFQASEKHWQDSYSPAKLGSFKFKCNLF